MEVPPEDDWFAEPAPGTTATGSGIADGEDWLSEEGQRPPPRAAFDFSALARRRLIIPVTVGLVLLIAILAAAGVFSGGGGTSTSPATTTSPVTTTTPAATTTQARPVARPPTTTLRPGATGAQVKLLQRALESLGYSTGAVDGDYGPATQRAVTAFQRARHLTADGVVGPKTLRALRQALAG